MATQAYYDWLDDGSPWEYARPVRAVGNRLAAHGYIVYLEGNMAHLTKSTPEDHTPFSVTGWPATSPYPYCMAMDIMPPRVGQVSKLTGRPLPTLAALGARLLADRQAGTPGTAWLKYMNWEPGDGNCWHETWQPGYARRTSTDAGHIHLSARTDYVHSDTADGFDLAERTEGAGMPLWGCDQSHFDAVPDPARVYAEGFRFMTHKAGGDANDPSLAAWWSAFKGWRDRMLLGAYWVLYPNNPAGRADAFLARLDSQCPGWRDGPFILQPDCEIWHGDVGTRPGKADVKAFCDRLAGAVPKLRPVVYAPKWAYDDKGVPLTGLGYPLWQSSYVSGSGSASSLYPGDTSTRWAAYSGQTPAILQFTSSATIAGQTTCDADAYRGTLDQLTALVAPGWTDDMPLTQADADLVVKTLLAKLVLNPYSGVNNTIQDQIRYIPSRDVVSSKVLDVMSPSMTALRESVDAAAERAIETVRDIEQREIIRDADNLTALLAAVGAVEGGSVTVEQLEQALAAVYGEAFARVQAAGGGRNEGAGE